MTKPIDITKPVRTRDGREVEDIKLANGKIIGYLKVLSQYHFLSWGADGRGYSFSDEAFDLVNVSELSEKGTQDSDEMKRITDTLVTGLSFTQVGVKDIYKDETTEPLARDMTLRDAWAMKIFEGMSPDMPMDEALAAAYESASDALDARSKK